MSDNLKKAILKDVTLLLAELDFPESSSNTFINALEKILNDEEASANLLDTVRQYEESEKCNYFKMLEDFTVQGEKLGIHKYTVQMLFFFCLAKKLKERYAERGIDLEIYYDTLADLRYKLNECLLIYKIDGTFVATWFFHHFRLELFALGRLQFELFHTKYEYTFRGKFYPVGSKVINIHIPRTGTGLKHSQVLEGYRRAEEMFGDEFGSEPIPFLCDSWLLDPWIPTVLKPDSNLTAFHSDFEIVKTGESREYSGLWTVFDRVYTGDISSLPNDTTLRRAYIERIKANEPFYYGHGMFYYKNGEFIK